MFLWPLYSLTVLYLYEKHLSLFLLLTLTASSDGFVIVLSETGENLWMLLVKATWTIQRVVFADLCMGGWILPLLASFSY